MYISLSLSWKYHFIIIREKMIKEIIKLMRIEMTPYQTHAYFNMYMLTSIFFGCTTVELNNKQIIELKRIYEMPIIKKFQLNRNFPKSLLYAWKLFLGLGLISLQTAIDILALKGYFGNKRVHRNVIIMIDINEQFIN